MCCCLAICFSGFLWCCELPLRIVAQLFVRLLLKREMVIIVLAWQENETSATDIFVGYTTTGNLQEIADSKHMVNVVTNSGQTNPDIVYKNGFVHLVYQDSPSGKVIYRRGIIGNLSVNEMENNEKQSQK